MTKDVLIFDCEVAPNAFGLGVKRLSDNRKMWYEFSDWEDFDRALVRRFMRRYQVVGFNSQSFDLPIIYLALNGASNRELMDAATKIIQERIPYWQSEREFEIRIPKLDHIDLYDTNPSVMSGLKQLGGRMHTKLLQELPFKPDTTLTRDEWIEGKNYCLNGDLEVTHELFTTLEEPIALREMMGKRYGTVDLRSKSDAQVGETVIKTQVEKRTNNRIQRATVAEGSTFRYDAPDWMAFKTPLMKEVFETIKNTDFVIGKEGRVSFPKEFSAFDITFDGMKHTLGIGGLHSTEANIAVRSDNQSILVEGDVASQYPSIIMKLGLFPKAMGREFLAVYSSILETRLAAKASKDKVTDKGLKIAINGAYGKLGSRFSTLYAPHLMVAVTLTGQLSLLMLIEAAHLRGIPCVSANTDGVIFRCPRDLFNGFVLRDDGTPTDSLAPSPLQEVVAWWEDLTSFKMEFGEYEAVYSQSVNTYMAIRPDGSFKRKGVLANHWRKELPWGGRNTDYDPMRSGLMKNPQMTICADAALGFLLKGIPIEETVFGCSDVREFITVVNATGGATWGPGDPIYKHHERLDNAGRLIRTKALVGYEGEEYLGKVVRYYWSDRGNPIIKVQGHKVTGNRPKVSKTDGCRPIMTLPDDYAVPADLDYQRYIDEAHLILEDIGYSAPRPPIESIFHGLLVN